MRGSEIILLRPVRPDGTERSIGKGQFGTFEQADELFLLYQLTRKQIEKASALTAYVSVADVDVRYRRPRASAERSSCPHDVADFARISLI
jgi:hypothetical protein